MKSNPKIKIIIFITLGILFALSPILYNSLNFNEGNSNDSNLDNKNLKISAVSGKIHIDNNWTAAKSAGIVMGNGTYSEPYIIEDLVIDAEGSGSGILIENSIVYFIIENCTISNSSGFSTAGIRLNNVTNGKLIDNNFSSNQGGISLSYSYNNTVSGNIANNNTIVGIHLSQSNNNIISENTASNNSYGYHDSNSAYGGIFLYRSNNNTVFGNIANNNSYGYSILDSGMILSQSNDNTIIGNTANYNSLGITLWDSDYNTVSGNTANNNGWDGIFLMDSNNTILYFNNFINNNKHAFSNGISNSWNSPSKIIYTYQGNNYTNYLGNYWDNYTGSDANNDGIGDTPFIMGGVIDNYPLMAPIENYEIIEILEPSEDSEGGIPGYNLFFLLGILSIVAIILSKKLKKS